MGAIYMFSESLAYRVFLWSLTSFFLFKNVATVAKLFSLSSTKNFLKAFLFDFFFPSPEWNL